MSLSPMRRQYLEDQLLAMFTTLNLPGFRVEFLDEMGQVRRLSFFQEGEEARLDKEIAREAAPPLDLSLPSPLPRHAAPLPEALTEAFGDAVSRLRQEHRGEALVAVLVTREGATQAVAVETEAVLPQAEVAVRMAADAFPGKPQEPATAMTHALWLEVFPKMAGRALEGVAFLGFGPDAEAFFAYLGPEDRGHLASALRQVAGKVERAPGSEPPAGGFGKTTVGQS